MRVAIFGASGFIGKHLSAALRARGDDVREGSMRDPEAAAHIAAECDAAVNLSGEPLAQRWNADVKRRILESRTLAPARFFDVLAKIERKPKAYISASAVGYYGTSLTQTFTESSPPGNDFLAGVCTQWEQIARRAADYGMRTACVRTGLVVARDGGVLERLLPVFKAGAGGRAGDGRQWCSWVHIDDVVGIYLLAIDAAEGALNATAPNPVCNQEFAQSLGRALHRPSVIPVPPFALRVLFGEGAQIVLEGQRVFPERTRSLGYAFKFSAIDAALADAVC